VAQPGRAQRSGGCRPDRSLTDRGFARRVAGRVGAGGAVSAVGAQSKKQQGRVEYFSTLPFFYSHFGKF